MIGTGSSSPPAPAPHAVYCRQARRIRRAFARQPALRMRALCALARDQDAQAADAAPFAIVTVPAGAARPFAQLVRQRMEGPVLRYAHRTRLIREAEQRGIGRFEANLIIAAVQHQAGQTRESEPVSSRSALGWTPLVGICATQSAILVALWHLVR